MKGMVLRYMLLAVIAAVAISGYGDGKADYAQMEMLVTNRLICCHHREITLSWLEYIKRQTGAKSEDVALCLGNYLKANVQAEPGTVSYSRYHSAMWLFTELADDKQYETLAEIAEMGDRKTAADALFYYYKKMRNRGGLEFVERLLARPSLSSNVYNEVSASLCLDASGHFGKDEKHANSLRLFSRRQLEKRKHCKLFDDVMLKLDSNYATSEMRRKLIDDIAANRVEGLSNEHKQHFVELRQNANCGKGGEK